MFKKILNVLFNKETWIPTLIGSLGWVIFWLGGGYVALFTHIQPWWYKLIFLAILGVFLYVLCVVIEHAVFKKLNKKN